MKVNKKDISNFETNENLILKKLKRNLEKNEKGTIDFFSNIFEYYFANKKFEKIIYLYEYHISISENTKLMDKLTEYYCDALYYKKLNKKLTNFLSKNNITVKKEWVDYLQSLQNLKENKLFGVLTRMVGISFILVFLVIYLSNYNLIVTIFSYAFLFLSHLIILLFSENKLKKYFLFFFVEIIIASTFLFFISYPVNLIPIFIIRFVHFIWFTNEIYSLRSVKALKI